MIRVARVLLSCTLWLVCLDGPMSAQAGRTLSGTVLDQSGAAVVGARVTIDGNGGSIAETKTGGDGRFALEAPSGAAAIVLRVSSPGFTEAVVRVTDERSDLRVVLQPSGLFETVTVTASRSDERLAAPVSTTVVSAAALTTQAAPAVDDVLRNTAGFGLTRRSSSRVANPSSQGVSMRGLAGNAGSRTLVLVDGLPLNDQFGGWVYWNRVPEAAIDRIEIVRGASGDLYGGDAVSGVIQLLTFSPSRPRARATFEGGSANTWRGSLFGGGTRDRWTGAVAGEWVQTDGEPVVAAAERGPVDVPAFSNYRTAYATAGYDTGRWRASVRQSVYQEARGNGTPAVTNDTNWRQTAATASGEAGGGFWSAQAAGGRQDYYNNFSSVPVSRQTERVTNEQRLPSSFASGVAQFVKPWHSQIVLFGAEAKRTDATVYDTQFVSSGVPAPAVVTGGIERVESIFGRAALQPADRLTVIIGARGDFWHSEPREAGAPVHAVNFFSPRLSVAWQASSTLAVRAAVTRASRTPTLDELHRNSRIGNTLTSGNPLLDPEELTGLEAGLTMIRPKTSLRATWFRNDLRNAITNITIGTSGTQVNRQKQNADNVLAQGLELEGDVRPLSMLSVSAGVVYTSSHFRNEVKVPALEGKQVPQIPSWQFNGTVTWTEARLATVSAQWRGSNVQFEDDLNTLPLGGYAVIDFFASRPLTRRLQVFAACENALNTEYQTGKTGSPPVTKVGWPRTYRAGIRITLP